MENKNALPILFAVMFLVMAGFGIIIPILPFYAEEMGASALQLGLLMSVYSIMQLIFSPIWGRISDERGRKPVIMIGIIGLSLSFFLMAWSTEIWMLFAARMIGGILSAANMPTVMAYVADITTPEERGKGMGIIGAATGLGFVFGPAIGGVFSEVSLSFPFIMSGALSLLTFFFVLLVLKEPAKHAKTEQKEQNKNTLFSLPKGPDSLLYIIMFIVTLSLAGLEATFAYFASEKAGIDSVGMGYIFMIMGLGGAIVQGGLVGILTKKYGEGPVIQLGILVSAIGFFLILLTDSFWTAAFYLTIFAIGNGMIRPSVSALLTKNTETAHGKTTGMISSFDSLGRILGPTLGGALYALSVSLPYISGVIISLAAFALYRVYHARSKQWQLKA